MKKTAIVVAALLVFGWTAGAASLARSHDDLRAIKKAVKNNPHYRPDREVRWFKVLIMDTRRDCVHLRVSIPLVLVEVVLSCAEDHVLQAECEEYDFDLRKTYRALKKAGPMALFELHDGEEEVLIRVWLE